METGHEKHGQNASVERKLMEKNGMEGGWRLSA